MLATHYLTSHSIALTGCVRVMLGVHALKALPMLILHWTLCSQTTTSAYPTNTNTTNNQYANPIKLITKLLDFAKSTTQDARNDLCYPSRRTFPPLPPQTSLIIPRDLSSSAATGRPTTTVTTPRQSPHLPASPRTLRWLPMASSRPTS